MFVIFIVVTFVELLTVEIFCVCVCVCGVWDVCVCGVVCVVCACLCGVVCVWVCVVCACLCVCVVFFVIYLLHSMPHYTVILHALHNLIFN